MSSNYWRRGLRHNKLTAIHKPVLHSHNFRLIPFLNVVRRWKFRWLLCDRAEALKPNKSSRLMYVHHFTPLPGCVRHLSFVRRPPSSSKYSLALRIWQRNEKMKTFPSPLALFFYLIRFECWLVRSFRIFSMYNSIHTHSHTYIGTVCVCVCSVCSPCQAGSVSFMLCALIMYFAMCM